MLRLAAYLAVLFFLVSDVAAQTTCASDGSDVSTNPPCDPPDTTGTCTSGECTDDGTGAGFCCPPAGATCPDGSDLATMPSCDLADATTCDGTCTDDGSGAGFCCPAAAATCADGSDLTANPSCDLADATTCTGTCTDDGTGAGFCCPAAATTAAAGATTTAGAGAVCRDIQTNCASYTDLCKNPTYQYMLAQKCAKTCKYCKASGCVDAKTECADWNSKGFCTSDAYTDATKKAYCASTCGKC